MKTLWQILFNSLAVLTIIGILGCLFQMKQTQVSVLIAVFLVWGISKLIKANHD